MLSSGAVSTIVRAVVVVLVRGAVTDVLSLGTVRATRGTR